MFRWIQKIFSKKKKEKSMYFDILVFEEDELADGSLGMKQHPENGVQASSRKELIGLYAMSGQKIKILREYGGEKPAGPIKTSVQNVTSHNVSAAPVPQAQESAVQTQKNIQQTAVIAEQKTAPKYYKIGDVEIKIDNGVSYQKQFVRLTDTEAANIRVVDDKTNKVVNLNNKHIEMKRWIRVETSNEDETAALEESFS